MLRVIAKRTSVRGARQQSTAAPPPPPPKAAPKPSGGGGGKLALVGITVAGAGGVVGYAYVDPEFRKQVETTVPPIKQVFDGIIGPANPIASKPQIQNVSAVKKVEKVLPPLELAPLPPIERKSNVHIEPVDVKKQSYTPATPPSAQLVEQKNRQLEDRLKSAIHSAEGRVRAATESKLRTINAINDHASILKQTVDDAKNANWENVTSALRKAEDEAKIDSGFEVDGRNYIDTLRQIVKQGKTDPITASNPLLLNAQETANKLDYQLDEINSLVNKSRQESSVLNQYKDLIEKSRQQFALEMKSILPNVDISAKDKNLNEDELNALIAHAHLKVDQLRRQLTEQQVREEQHIAQALENQRHVDERISADKLNLELNRVARQREVDIEQAVLQSRSSWNNELEDQLKRTTHAHSEHLEQVIRTQRQLFEIEQNQKIEEAVGKERDLHSAQIGAAISRLDGIEEVLGSRIALDNENRRTKQFWIACHNLLDTIRYGNKAGNDIDSRRLSLKESLNLLKEVNPEDEFVNAVIASFPQQAVTSGTYTEQDLKNRFEKLYKVGRQTSTIDENGGSLGSYFWSYVRSLFLVDLPRQYADNEPIDVNNIGNIDVLARARYYVRNGDFDKAIRIIQLLKGQPANLARDWVVDVRASLESQLLVELLVAHAAVTSIRSTY
ncbi:unnamed protein product [Caenorhabditis angaria]|uniref:MICOS complex subunit MIC60 n=1 Tax=Caenorhabditis angaria TaxID=860376 RepID=A0A9P1J3T6_9PELO|nr:unnamed protein product [Caenorhabditis angaria]